MCCGYLKEQSQRDGSFLCPKQMLKQFFDEYFVFSISHCFCQSSQNIGNREEKEKINVLALWEGMY